MAERNISVLNVVKWVTRPRHRVMVTTNIYIYSLSKAESPKNTILGVKNLFLRYFGLREAPVYICIYIKEKIVTFPVVLDVS